jgi:hypothetical protein
LLSLCDQNLPVADPLARIIRTLVVRFCLIMMTAASLMMPAASHAAGPGRNNAVR